MVVGKTDGSVTLDELSQKMLQNPLSIMRQKITDIMLECNFDENEMIISAIKTKYTKKAIKRARRNISYNCYNIFCKNADD